MNSIATHFRDEDSTFYSGWAWTHFFFGGAFFIILYKYFGMSAFNTIILLLIIHTVYEWKDIHVAYNVYDNHPGKVKAAHDFLASQSFVDKYGALLSQLPVLKPGFHIALNSAINSIGDTVFYIAGIALAYHFRDKVRPLFVKILILIAVLYWVKAVILYFYVTGLGLHNKDRVNEIYSNSLMLHSM